MKLIFRKEKLLESINIASKAVPNRTTNEIYNCLLIDATRGKITLVGNDTEFGIETECDGTISEPGKIAVDAKIFSEIIKRLPEDENSDVIIETDEHFQMSITCESSLFRIACRNGDEFTGLPTIDRTHFISISQLALRDIISQTIFSIAQNDPNKKMTGEYFSVNEDVLTVVALDGHRVSIRKARLNEKYDREGVIIPGRSLNEITKILTGGVYDESVIYFSENHVLFEFGRTTVVTRLIDGEYFHVEQMISEDYSTKVTVNRRELIDNISRSTIFIRDTDNQPLVLKIEDNVMSLMVHTELGRMNAEIAISKNGNDLIIGFNPKFLLDALNAISDEEVNLYLTIPRSPLYIRNNEDYNYMILPVNFNQDAL